MNDTIRTILHVLATAKPERRVAAAQILAELKPKDQAVIKALADQLHGGEPFLTRYVMEALAAVGTRDATRALVERTRLGPREAEQVALILAGEDGCARELAQVFDSVDGEAKSRLVAIVGKKTGKEALAVVRKALLASEPGVSDAALRALKETAPQLPEEGRRQLVAGLAKDIERKDLPPSVQAHGATALGLLDATKARAQLLRLCGAKHGPQVRQAALNALRATRLTTAQADSLLALASDPDMTFVARPAMALLAHVDKWGAGSVVKLKKLVENGDEEQRRFALHALRNCNTEAVAKMCIAFLRADDDAYYDVAIDALRTNDAAVDLLLAAFHKEKGMAEARRLAAPFKGLGPRLQRTQVNALVERAARQAAGDDPLIEITLSLLMCGDRDMVMASLADRAQKLRRARKVAHARELLRRAAGHAELSPEAQYQLALCRLLDNGRVPEAAAPEPSADDDGEPTVYAPSGNATMGFFTSLVRDGFPLLDRLKRETQLTPDHLVRIGGHFAEGVAEERRFGSKLLHHVANKHGRARAGEQAKNLLRAEGL